MEFVEVTKVRKRMCATLPCCASCPLHKLNNRADLYCESFIDKFPEKAEEIIMKWAKEHPFQTNGSHFLEEFPNAYASGRKYSPNEMVYIHLNRPGNDADGIYFPAEWWDKEYKEMHKDANNN